MVHRRDPATWVTITLGKTLQLVGFFVFIGGGFIVFFEIHPNIGRGRAFLVLLGVVELGILMSLVGGSLANTGEELARLKAEREESYSFSWSEVGNDIDNLLGGPWWLAAGPVLIAIAVGAYILLTLALRTIF